MADEAELTIDEVAEMFGGAIPADPLKVFMGPGTVDQKRKSLELLAAAHKDPRIGLGVLLAKEVYVEMMSNNTKTFEELIPDEQQRTGQMVFWIYLFKRVCAAPEFKVQLKKEVTPQ